MLTVFRGGFTGDADSGDFAIEFFDDMGVYLGGRFHGHSDPSDLPTWTEESVTALVPPGTRSIRISSRGWRVGGTQCSAYFDDFALALEPSGNNNLALLYAVDAADAAGWVNDVSALAAFVNRTYGETCFAGAATAAVEAHQDFDIPTGLEAAVAAGDGVVHLYAQHGSFNDNDAGRIAVEFLDGTDTLIVGATIEEASSPVVDSIKFTPVHITGPVPTNAAKIRLILEMERNDGSNLDAYYCRIALMISETSA